MKKLTFYILGFCLIPFYLLRNLKLFPSTFVKLTLIMRPRTQLYSFQY